uniref:restriction endonuclease subunit S n=1 Tax=Arachnia propionica TaxID=1750 RepID=UPI003C6EE395
RRRQYEHYRSALLSFPAGDAKSSTLGELAVRVSSGGTPHSGTPEYYESGNIPWLRSQDINGSRVFHTGAMITKEGLLNSSARWIPKNCVIVAMYGATAARVAINEIPLTTNQACCNIELDSSKADYRYVFFWIANQYETLKALGEGSQSNLNSRKIKSFPILVPPLEEQRRIVSVLDKFDSLVNDLSIGLPAELAARRKQYEYYRDRLLTFEEKR